jgi:Cu(I)/Ag(I) efflux system protein CusF
MNMKLKRMCVALTMGVVSLTPVLAQTMATPKAESKAMTAKDMKDMNGMAKEDDKSTLAQSGSFTEAEVKKVDKENNKITLKHGEIKNLDMPPMTMVFGVSDAAMLGQIKAGDKVRFRADSKQGKLTVIELKAAK